MRRIPRLRTAMPAGFVPSPLPCSALRAPAAASPSPRLNPLSSSNRRTTRCLSTTLFRASQSQTPTTQQTQAEVEAELAAAAEDLQEVETYEPSDIATQLLYPGESTTAPLAADVNDSSYKPAETGDGLEEVGGLAGWWDEPTHWGGDDGVTGFVRSVTTRFGPADKVTDPAVLEVLAKRAIVEALVAARFAGPKRKAVDRLFAHAGGMDRLGEIVEAEIVAGEDGAATLREEDWQTAWDAVKSAARKSKPKAKTPEAEASETETAEAAEGQQDGVLEATATEVPQLTPDAAKSLVGSWNKGWKRAELKDPVVKFFAAKRIQQLTGYRIPDGKLLAAGTIHSLLEHLVEPPKPKKLAELVETKGVFKDLPNVRVFPRRVTPIDKEKMVGRWKIIVSELEKRDLPIIGTGNHGAAVEKKWVEGRA